MSRRSSLLRADRTRIDGIRPAWPIDRLLHLPRCYRPYGLNRRTARASLVDDHDPADTDAPMGASHGQVRRSLSSLRERPRGRREQGGIAADLQVWGRRQGRRPAVAPVCLRGLPPRFPSRLRVRRLTAPEIVPTARASPWRNLEYHSLRGERGDRLIPGVTARSLLILMPREVRFVPDSPNKPRGIVRLIACVT